MSDGDSDGDIDGGRDDEVITSLGRDGTGGREARFDAIGEGRSGYDVSFRGVASYLVDKTSSLSSLTASSSVLAGYNAH